MINYMDYSRATPILPINKFTKVPAKILIYGAGNIGQLLLKQVKEISNLQFIGFVDKNKSTVQNNTVYHLSEIASVQFDYILISPYRYQDEIFKALERYNVDSSKIVSLQKDDFVPSTRELEASYPIIPIDRIPNPSNAENLKILIYGAGYIGLNLMKQLSTFSYAHLIGFVDRNVTHAPDSLPVYTPKDISKISFDYILIGSYVYQEEICETLKDLKIDNSKIVKLGVQDFEMNCTKYESDQPYSNLMSLKWNRGNYKSRCLLADKHLSDLLILDLGFAERDALYHIVKQDGKYIGTLTRKTISHAGVTGGENPTLSCLCECMTDIASLDKSISFHMTLNDIKGCFLDYKEKELVVLDDLGTIVDVLSIDRFIANFVQLRYSQEQFSNIYEPLIKDLSNGDDKTNCNTLNRYAYNLFTQNGEDGIIEEIFSRIGYRSKIVVEFGAGDGIGLSNSRRLILNEGFSAVLIEGNEQRYLKGIETYKDNLQVKFINGYVTFEGQNTLENILSNLNISEDPDLISIDIDGYDYHVWDSIVKYRPRVVLIEFNPTISNEIIFINPKCEHELMGSSPSALVQLGMKKGYSLAAVTACNCIFVVDEEFEKLEIQDNDLAALRPKNTCTTNTWWQTYNRKIYHSGDDKFIWKNKKFISNQFDVSQ